MAKYCACGLRRGEDGKCPEHCEAFRRPARRTKDRGARPPHQPYLTAQESRRGLLTAGLAPLSKMPPMLMRRY